MSSERERRLSLHQIAGVGVRYIVYWHLLSAEPGSQALKVNLIVYDNDVGVGHTGAADDTNETLADDAGDGDELLSLGAGVLPDDGQTGGDSDERGQCLLRLSLCLTLPSSHSRNSRTRGSDLTCAARENTPSAPRKQRRKRLKQVLPE